MAVDLRQTYFRFGRNSGLEASHAWLGNENANISFRVETTFLLRFNIQEAGGTAINNVDNQFTYNLNGAGWNNITTTSSVVKAVASNCFSDIAHCTQRLSGTGTFETSASGCTVDGLSGGGVNDIAASGCSETECSLQIVSADVNNGDTIQFRITSPDGTITYTVTPTLTVIKESLSYSSALAFVGTALRWLTSCFKTNSSSISFSGSASGVFSYAFQYLVGTVTYVYQKAAAQTRTLGGVLSISGLVSKLLQKLRTKAGALNLSGTLSRLINKLTRTYAGGLSFGGVPSRLINNLTRVYAGAVSFSGVARRLLQNVTHTNRADISFTGLILSIISYIYGRLSGAQLSLSGVVTRLINNVTHSYQGSVGFSGLSKRLITSLAKVYAGAVGFGGNVLGIKNARFIQEIRSGVISFSSFINKAFSSIRSSTITPSGLLSSFKVLWRRFDSSVSFTGILTKAFSYVLDRSTLNIAGVISKASTLRRRYVSSISFSSLLNKARFVTREGTLSFSGAYSYVKSFVQKQYAETRSGTQSLTGSISRSINLFRSVQGYIPPLEGERIYQGILSFLGNLTPSKVLKRTKEAVLTIVGDVTSSAYVTGITRTYEGAISIAGVIAYIEVWKFGRMSAVLSFAGQVAGVLFETVRYTRLSWWAIGSGAISRSVKAARTYSSTLSVSGAASRIFSCFESYSGSLSLNSILEFVKTGGASAISILEDGWLSITGTSSRRVQLAMAYSGNTSFSAGYTHQSGFFRELFSGVHPYAADIGSGSGVTGGEFMMDMTLGV